MINKFTEFNSKMKFITGCNTNVELADELEIVKSTFQTMKNNDKIPFEKALKYLEDKCIDANWLFKLREQ